MSSTGMIFNIQRFSLHDGPGIRTTVFMKGCPLRCRWCSNPESLDPRVGIAVSAKECAACGTCAKACPHGAIAMADVPRVDAEKCVRCLRCLAACPAGALAADGAEYTPDALLAEALKDVVFYRKSGGGVTFSGGEPLLQADFLVCILEKLRDENVHTAMETSAYCDSDLFSSVVQRLDLVYVDLKHPDPAPHRAMTGVSPEPIWRNVAALAASGKDYAIRIPVIPRFNHGPECARRYTVLLSELGVLPEARVFLLPFHRLGSAKWEALGMEYGYRDDPGMAEEEVSSMAEIFRGAGYRVQIGG